MAFRVGTVTFHRSYNYGSALQAYALQKYLEDTGYEVKIIDFVMPLDFEQYKLFHKQYYKTNKRAFISDIIHFISNYKRKHSFEKFVCKYMHLTSKQYDSSEKMKELNEEFDAFICGSDQIWNFACTRGEPAYFLDFVNKEKVKIAYSPSIAHKSFDENYDNILTKYLDSFDFISLREESTIPIIKNLVTKSVKVVLDPTLLLKPIDYAELIVYNKNMKENYIFVYMLEQNETMIEYARKISKKLNCNVVYILRKNIKFSVKAHNVYGCSPNEFLGYIKNATYIITNSFHATVFSVQFCKKFCTFLTQKSGTRMNDLLEKIGLNERIYEEEFSLDKDIDYLYIHKRLDELRYDSERYLQGALDGRKKEIDT